MNLQTNMSNVSIPTNNRTQTALISFTLLIRCATFLLGVIGNGLVIYVAGHRIKRTVNTVWFLNLAVADFLFVFFLIFDVVSLYNDLQWQLGDFMCKLNSLVVMLSMFASIFLLTAISVDRCMSIWLVAWARNKRTVQKARLFCLFIWLASIICSIPFFIYRKLDQQPTATFCILDLPNALFTYEIIITFRFTMGFIIPFIIITCSYVAIGVRARRLKSSRKLKTFRVILAVILAFFFCWLPLHVIQFIELWAHKEHARNGGAHLDSFKDMLNLLKPLLTSLAYFNSCLNPILYVFMCKEFQRKLKQSLLLVFESAFAEEHIDISHTSQTTTRDDTLTPTVMFSNKGIPNED